VLVSPDTAAAERHRNDQIAGEQPAQAAPPRPRSHPEAAEWPPAGSFRRTKAMIFSARKAF
jgi:hypothetical protein